MYPGLKQLTKSGEITVVIINILTGSYEIEDIDKYVNSKLPKDIIFTHTEQ